MRLHAIPGTLWAEAFGGRWIPAEVLVGQRTVFCVCGPVSPAVPLALLCDGPPRRRHRRFAERLERMGYQVPVHGEAMSSKKIDRETIPLGLIARSPANPRKTFDAAALQELAESIKLHGVLQPIVVRPIVQRVTRGPLKGASQCYELVAGERRVRAAELAGLTEIPATIRELSDQAADQIRLVENDQRADLSPIERADAYGIYLLQHGATVEDLAAAVGKSPSTVRNILRLRNVPQEIRFAVEDGRISASVAGLIARVPGRYHRDTVALCVLKGILWRDAQSFATKNFSKMLDAAEPLSFRDTKELIATCCTRELKQAQFSRQRLDLVPEAGSCDACPKRAGNDPELVAEGVRADVCTDPACFEKKTEVWQQEQVRLAAENGQKVLSGKEAAKVFGYGGRLAHGCGYVDLMEQPYQDKKRRSIKQLLGKHLADKDVVLAIDDRGQLHRIVSRKVADPILKKEHKLELDSYRSTTAPLTAAEKKRRQAAIEEGKLRRAETRAILAAAHRAALDVFALALHGGPETGPASLLRHLVSHQIDQAWGSVLEDLCDRRGLKGRMDERRETLRAQVRAMDGAELAALLVEFLADRKILHEDGKNDLARDLGLDVAKIRKQAAQDLKNGTKAGTPLAQVLAPQANGAFAHAKDIKAGRLSFLPAAHPIERTIEDAGDHLAGHAAQSQLAESLLEAAVVVQVVGVDEVEQVPHGGEGILPQPGDHRIRQVQCAEAGLAAAAAPVATKKRVRR